jgi:hypothetical protein
LNHDALCQCGDPENPLTVFQHLFIVARIQKKAWKMGTTGMIIGVALLALVVVVAFLLGRKAEASVEQFREEHHEQFKGPENR